LPVGQARCAMVPTLAHELEAVRRVGDNRVEMIIWQGLHNLQAIAAVDLIRFHLIITPQPDIPFILVKQNRMNYIRLRRPGSPGQLGGKEP